MREERKENLTCLAEGCVYPTSLKKTGINANEIIVGPTRSGKTTSVIEPKLLHTFEGSLIINVTKRALVGKYAPVFKDRGYQVWDLNLSEPMSSNVSYDPFEYIHTNEEIIKLAETMVGSEASSSRDGVVDPYWNQSAVSGLAAIMGLAKMNAESENRKVTFSDFYELYNNCKLNMGDRYCSTTLDDLFDEAEYERPNNQFGRMWKTIRGNSPRTAACIYSVMNNAVDKLMTEDALEMMQNDKKVSFEELSTKKTVLFVTTSPVNKTMQKLTNMFFTDAFRLLFEYAETLPDKELPSPVHLICDDFATGCKIPYFYEYLSVFCAKKISVTLLLQSESQLSYMYGKSEATTIINNCDTYVYFGGMDDETCYNISKRRNIPVEDVYSMPLEQVMVFRRGSKPVTSRRYQTFEDGLYKQLFDDSDNEHGD
ncbi:MAG: type IV secretory system conjugative DNA transfer family protein [Lachnospiraceae bacterium]|nr:type IV secretory system conjugative DNA transfer family protein [Lachnospiraceae bacterium]